MSGYAFCAMPDVRIVKLSETIGAITTPRELSRNIGWQWKRSSASTVA